jgi:hypothetical protein
MNQRNPMTVRLPVESRLWLDKLAKESGLSLNETIVALIVHCQKQQISHLKIQWEVEVT